MEVMRHLILLSLVFACNQRPLGPVGSATESLCQFDQFDKAGDRAVLAVLTDNQVQLVHADGSRTTAVVFTHPEARNFFSPGLAARGDFVAASASWVIGDNAAWNTDVALLSRDGRVRWQTSRPNSSYGQLLLNAHGVLAVSLGADGILVDEMGRERALLGLPPVAEPTEDGSVLVRQGQDPGVVGWVRAGADAMEPLGHATADPYATPVTVAGRAAYLASADGGPLFVSELPGDARTVLLPGIDPTMVAITDHTDSGWALVGEWRTPRYLVNVRTLEARPIGANTPDGFRPFQGSISGPQLDADGSILVGLRNDYAGALYRSSNGRDWQQLGGTVTHVLDIDPLARGGTYLINATSGRYSTEEWQPAPANQTPDYDGDVLQIVRPQSGVAQKLPLSTQWIELWDVRLSNDGRCLAYTDGEALSALDVERGKTFSLGTAGGAFGWIE
jgi:hypothetical protein